MLEPVSRERRARSGAALLTILLCGACSVPTAGLGFVFSTAIEDGTQLPHVLWIERVEIEQPVLPEQDLIETAFTYNFARLVRQKKLFKAVNIETGAAAPDDWVARVRIERCTERGQVPLSAVLGTIATLGIYTAIGQIQVLDFEMAGRLEIRDGRGQLLGTGAATRTATLPVYQKNRTNAFSFFLDERSRFADELIEQALIAAGARES